MVGRPVRGSERDDARRLALLLCRRDAAERLDPAVAAPLADREFRRCFFRFSERHAVHGLALSVLSRSRALDGLPRVVAETLQDRLRTLRRQTAAHLLERDRVLEAMGAHRIRSVILKGGAIADTLYRDLGERLLRDVDVLVPASRVEDALRALADIGYRDPRSEEAGRAYREHHFHLQLLSRGGITVELHWALVRPSSPFSLPADVFLRNRVLEARLGESPVPVPARECTLLHLVLQNVEDGFPRISRLVDVDRILEKGGIDWDAVGALASRANLGPALALTLALASKLLGTPVSDDVRDRFLPGRTARLHLALLRPAARMLDQSLPRSLAPRRLLSLWLLPALAGRASFLGRLSRPEGHEDPMSWIWQGLASPPLAGSPSRAAPLVALGKLAIYQGWLYARGIAGLVTRTGWDGYALWGSPRGPGRSR